jgi:hypothetical protein
VTDSSAKSFEIDHFFICTAAGGLVADRLIQFGFTEGSPNRHPGQGTANRRFFFDNAFLELVWLENPDEASSDLVRRTKLYERCTNFGGGASPFGVCLRPKPGAARAAPFSAWEYRPPYLPDPLMINMGSNFEILTEPLLFYLAFARRPDPANRERWQPRDHAAGTRRVTRLLFCNGTSDALSPELRAARASCDGLTFTPGNEYLLEVGFDEERAGRSFDFRPALPLRLRL